jgi:ATP-dependent helicase/nuclease subunit B
MRIATIPAGLPFVDALAAGLLAEVALEPEALADVQVLLPTRRACRSLGEAFLRRAGGRPLLLPRIQPIGEIEADELLLDGTLELALPPAIGSLRRQLLLARPLAGLDWSLEHALRLAGELASLLDELQTEQVPLDRLDHLVPDALAGHWQKSRAVLAVIAEGWPGLLAAEQALDPAERRHRLLSALAAGWREVPPPGRIVAAGSTGSIPATRELLRVIAGLPRGTVVLPGLDQDLDEPSWRLLEPGHPQAGLRQLLAALGVERSEVARWPAPGVGGSDPARARLLSEVMRPSATVEAWQSLPPWPATALEQLVVEEHPDLPSEALALALRMRAALETPGRTAALVTPDRHLARRVAIELRRWQIEVDDSAGTPLDQTPPGGFLLLCARLIVDGVSPVALLATLKHPLARGGEHRSAFRQRVRALELACLRGPRLSGGFTGILAELNARARAQPEPERAQRLGRLADWVGRLQALAERFQALAEQPTVALPRLVEAHLAFAEALARDAQGSAEELWSQEAGEAAASFAAELLEACDPAQPVAPRAYPALLAQAMAARPVRPRAPRHPRLFIWGELEARLQAADLVLLGGLNEGVWPRAADPGPWLNRSMREQLGLPPVERRTGLAAHDFVQAASAAEVVLSRAEKDVQGAPTVASRWLVRLQTLLAAPTAGAALASTGPWRAWAEQLEAVAGVPGPVAQPAPRPPLAARPRRLSVSDVGTWMSDPYELYAKRILRLKPLDALDADPGALERGIIVHHALERFVRQYPAALPADAEQQLHRLGREVFAPYVHRPRVRAVWWPRFLEVARWVIAQERLRRPGLVEVMAEVTGELELAAPGGAFVLTARADRLERHADGRITVIDYKTGQLPKGSDVLAGRQPQLPLEAALVEAGGFTAFGEGVVAELLFWRLYGDEEGGKERAAVPRAAPAELADAARAGLAHLVAHYDRSETTYPARARPRSGPQRDYDHLARRGEWPA